MNVPVRSTVGVGTRLSTNAGGITTLLSHYISIVRTRRELRFNVYVGNNTFSNFVDHRRIDLRHNFIVPCFYIRLRFTSFATYVGNMFTGVVRSFFRYREELFFHRFGCVNVGLPEDINAYDQYAGRAFWGVPSIPYAGQGGGIPECIGLPGSELCEVSYSYGNS